MGAACSCKSRAEQAVEVVEDPAGAEKLTIAFVGARGLRGVDWFPGTERFFFATVGIHGQEGSELHKTKDAKDTVAPFWKEEATIKYSLGDSLEFAVWDADAYSEGDLMGHVVLESERFSQAGFNGELQLIEGREPVPCFLRVKVKLDGEDYPEGPVQEFSVPIGSSKKRPLGMDFESQDGTTLYVTAVKGGLIEEHNKKSDPSHQVRPGDFVMKVNNAQGKSAQLLEAIKKPGNMTLLIRRPMEMDVAIVGEEEEEEERPRDTEPCVAPRRSGSGQTACVAVNFDETVHGMKFKSGSGLIVTSVGEGPVKTWNRANPDHEVRSGDRIIAVDGKAGTAGSLLRKLKADMFHMTVVRPAEPEEPVSKPRAKKALS